MIRASKPAILVLIIILALISYFVPFKPLSILSVILLALIAIWIIMEKQKPGITNRILKNMGETEILLKEGTFNLNAPAADVTVKTTNQPPFAIIDGNQVAITEDFPIKRDSKEVRKIDLYIPSSLSSVSLLLVSGDLDAREMKCETLHAKTVSGNVRLTYIICDTLEAKSISGDVEINEHKGTHLDAASVSGDVEAETDSSDVSVATTSGSIDIIYTGARKPTVTASSTSGSWEVYGKTGRGSFTETGTDGSISAKSISGDIKIRG
ncbi:MAG: DUF4097 family beta strand repeat-containing protein [Bullifex sp.]